MAKDKKSNSKKSGQLMNGKLLKVHTKDALDNYFDNLNGQKPGDLYSLVLGQVIKMFLQSVQVLHLIV